MVGGSGGHQLAKVICIGSTYRVCELVDEISREMEFGIGQLFFVLAVIIVVIVVGRAPVESGRGHRGDGCGDCFHDRTMQCRMQR